jgi:hypothetical protein
MDAEASGSRTSKLSSHGDENVVQDTPPQVLWKKHLSLMYFVGHQDQVIHLKDGWDFVKDRHVMLRIL